MEDFILIAAILFLIFTLVTSKKWRFYKLIKEQYLSFCDWETKRILKREIITFFIVPAIFSFVSVSRGMILTNSGQGMLLNVVSIISGLLISSLIGINTFDINQISDSVKIKQLIEVASTYIMFSIFITAIILIISLPDIFKFKVPEIYDFNLFSLEKEKVRMLRDGVIFYFFIVYIMNIFMILRKLMQIFEEKKK